MGNTKGEVVDHLGYRYKNLTEMCKLYNISAGTYKARLDNGYSLQECLEGRKTNTPVEDHMGRMYANKSEMCKAYGVDLTTYQKKRKAGLSVKDSLKNNKLVEDHLGNIYRTQTEMCKAYGVHTSTFIKKKKEGYTLEECLNPKEPPVKDHLGNSYPNRAAMCKAYDVPVAVYRQRTREKLSLEECLGVIAPEKKETSIKATHPKGVTDPLGNEYPSVKVMCEVYGVRLDFFEYRMKKGLPLEECLLGYAAKNIFINEPCVENLGIEYPNFALICKAHHVPICTYILKKQGGYATQDILLGAQRRATVDHLGNMYETIDAMCTHYGITTASYRSRLKRGFTVEETLTGKFLSKGKPIACTDHLGNKYPTKKEMCLAYGVDPSTLARRLREGCSLEEALLGKYTTKVVDHLGNKYPTKKDMCVAYGIYPSTFTRKLR